MADLLQNNEIFFSSFEPKVQNRFILYCDGIPSFILKKCDRPKLVFERKAIDHMNLQWYYKGKGIWQEMSMELYDPIVPSGAQAVMEWARLAHESITGRDGYTDMYKKDLTLNILGPVGDKVEEWSLRGCFITNADFGSMDWANTSDHLPITLQISIDYAVLQY